MRHLVVLLALMVLMIFSVGGTEAGATYGWRSATNSTAAEADLRARINAEHHRVCGNYLTNDSQLVTLARYRSTDMGIRRWFGHVSPEGLRLASYLSRSGIRYHYGGEDIAWNNYPIGDAANGAFSGFMASTTHRHLIQDCHFTRIGVGAYHLGGYRNIFTVLFLQP